MPQDAWFSAMKKDVPADAHTKTSIGVEFALTPQAVLDAREKAAFWIFPTGLNRPLPMGTMTIDDVKEVLGRAHGYAVSDWEFVNGSHVKIRYHYAPLAPESDRSNVNTMLLSSRMFDIECIAEFQ